MTACVIGADQTRWTLPKLLAWRLEYTAGVPCDSFWVRCAWDVDNTARPEDWVRFEAEYEGERVFTGVVDECEVSITAQGRVLEVSGRGMAALLLDNEALGQDYQIATQKDIVRDHVRPYGISVASGRFLSFLSPPGAASGRWSMSLPATTEGSRPGLTGRAGWCWPGGTTERSGWWTTARL